jgi:hypothetical protein
MKHIKMFEAFVNEEEKMDAQELANHVWMNWKKITGLSNSKRNEEGHFPDKVMVLLKQHGVDYMAFSDAWNDAAEMNEKFSASSFFTTSELQELRDFAEEVSDEIMRAYEKDFDSKKRGLDEKDYTPEAIFNYISEWGADNDMTVDEIQDEFNWRELTQELGLENPPGK